MKTARKIVLLGFAVAVLGLVVVGAGALVRALVHHAAGSAVGLGIAAVGLLVAMVLLRPRVRRRTVLELDLTAPPPEVADRSPLAALRGAKPLTLSETVQALHRASRDPRVSGLVVRPRFDSAPLATIEELCDAIAAVRVAGKATIAVADTYGEAGESNSPYVLACACETVVVHPTGEVGLLPLDREANFYRGLLDRIGVQMQVLARHEYKNVFNQLTERGFTTPHLDATQRMFDSFWEQIVAAVAAARGLDAAAVRAAAENGPLAANEALAAGLIDRLAFTDEAIADAKARAGDGAKLLGLATYKKRAGKGRQKGKAVPVAVITAVGEINRSKTRPFGLTGGPVLAADELIGTIRAVAKNKRIKAVVLRIDSPGGSAVASENLWRELVLLRETRKPLVVSMGAVAASGGYEMAAAADRIVAQPGTVTGSIGVITAVPLLGDAKAKLGITAAGVHTGQEPGISVNRPLSKAQRARLDAHLDDTYDVFTTRVATGRKLPIRAVLDVAKGRVWTGADGATNGLVDELGGLTHALDVAVDLTGAAAGSRADLRPFPKKANPLAQLRGRSGESSDDVTARAAGALGPRSLPPALGILASLAMSDGGVMTHLGLDPRSLWV